MTLLQLALAAAITAATLQWPDSPESGTRVRNLQSPDITQPLVHARLRAAANAAVPEPIRALANGKSGGWFLAAGPALEAAARDSRPLILLIYDPACGACLNGLTRSLDHPAVVRRLASMVPLALSRAEALARFSAVGLDSAELAAADPGGVVQFTIDLLPDSNPFEREVTLAELSDFLGQIQDVAELLGGGAKLRASGDAAGALLVFGHAYRNAGDPARAATAFEGAERIFKDTGAREGAQTASVFRALIDLELGSLEQADARLTAVTLDPATPWNEAEGWLGLGQLALARGNAVTAGEMFLRAARLAPEGSRARATALELAGLDGDVVRLLSPGEIVRPLRLVIDGTPPFAGKVEVRAVVSDPSIDRVDFHLDGALEASDETPPFGAVMDTGSNIRPRLIRAVGLSADGSVLTEDQVPVNSRHDRFAIRAFMEEDGERHVARADLAVPLDGRLRSVDFFIDGRKVATRSEPPWLAVLPTGSTDATMLRLVARLEDGRIAEDALVLSSAGLRHAIDVHDIEIYASVIDSEGRPVTGLRKENFRILEDGKERPIEGFEFLAGERLTAGVVIDSSASMIEEMNTVREAAREFLSLLLGSGGRAFLVDFDTEPRLLAPTSADRPLLVRGIEKLVDDGDTALYDAILFGLLQLHEVPGQRSLVVLTDGFDTTSRWAYEDVVRAAREIAASVYVILIDSDLSRRDRRMRRVREEMEQLAASTGGRAWHLRDAKGLARVYREIDRELRNQYVLTYRATPAKSQGEWRDLRVLVEEPEVEVRTISGFLAR